MQNKIETLLEEIGEILQNKNAKIYVIEHDLKEMKNKLEKAEKEIERLKK